MKLAEYLTNQPKKHIIFDLDSTILEMDIDWSTYRRDTWDVIAGIDKPLTEEVPFAHAMGMVLTNKAIAKHGQKAKKIIDPFVENYEETHYHGYTPNPELLQFLRSHNGTYSFYLWTSNARKTALRPLQSEGITHLFAKIVTRNDVMLLKPSPDGFSLIYDTSVPKSEYLMVGDNTFDKGAAEQAGIDFFLVDYFSR